MEILEGGRNITRGCHIFAKFETSLSNWQVHPGRDEGDHQVMGLDQLLELLRILNIEVAGGERVGA